MVTTAKLKTRVGIDDGEHLDEPPSSAPPPPADPLPTPVPEEVSLVSLGVFLQVSGHKADQMAGFQNHAQRQGLTLLSVKDWHARYQEFQNRPVR